MFYTVTKISCVRDLPPNGELSLTRDLFGGGLTPPLFRVAIALKRRACGAVKFAVPVANNTGYTGSFKNIFSFFMVFFVIP